MNANTSSPNDRPDDLDRMLGDFFKAQVPKRWPHAPAGHPEIGTRATPRHQHQGRVTLAASVACLLGLGLALSYGPTFHRPAPAGGDLLRGSDADGKGLHKHMAPDQQSKLP